MAQCLHLLVYERRTPTADGKTLVEVVCRGCDGVILGYVE